MSRRLMTNAMRTPILYATTAGFSLGAVQALLFTVRRIWLLGYPALAHPGSIVKIGLMGFLVGTVTWWLFVARRNVSKMSVWRGVIIGALSSLTSMVILPIGPFVIVLLGGLGTETAGHWFDIAGEGALLVLAGIIGRLLREWMDVIAAMIVGGILISRNRRGAGPVASDQLVESEQEPS